MSRARGSWIIARGSPDLAERFRTDLGAVQAGRDTIQSETLYCFLNSRAGSRSSDLAALIRLTREFQDTTVVLVEHAAAEPAPSHTTALIILNGRIVHELPHRSGAIGLSSIDDLSKNVGFDLQGLSLHAAVPPSFVAEDWMNRALVLARRQIGKVAPNPAVGCVIVKGGELVGEGATGSGGRPHAEEVALADAGDLAAGGEVFVTLAPCGERTAGRPSCSHLLAKASIARLHVACEDPHPLAAHGLSYLKAAGINTSHGLLQAEAEAVNCGFFKVVRTGRPWVAIDSDPSRYDRAFEPIPGEDHRVALGRLGRDGVTRVFIRPDTQLSIEFIASGLVDEISPTGIASSHAP
jgi:diaminohydroxyphosphoribosylaminopyrimidine deaminase/5-amino-6-(5-phosphoribosylamino)uracil reductase